MALTQVSVLVPWAPSTEVVSGPERDASWAWNEKRIRAFLPTAELVLGVPDVTGDPGVFSRSQALNRAAALATGDIFVVCDADTTYTATDFLRAIELAEDGHWTLPLRYVRLSQRTSAGWIASGPLARVPDDWERGLEQEYPFANSGVVVFPRAAFEAMDGFDERFKGWGGEDDAQRAALEALYRAPTRVGIAYHLWHPRLLEHTTQAPYGPESRVLADRYGAAAGSREEMLALIAERG